MRWRVGAIIGAVLLFPLGASMVADEVTTPGPFSVSINEVVHIELVPASIGSIITHRADLLQQYLYISTIDVRAYTITNYQVWFSKTTAVTQQAPGGTTTAFETIRNELMELRILDVGPLGDDGIDDPTLQFSEAVDWEDIHDTSDKRLFRGGNTEGGVLNYQYASVAFRFDLAALRNNASGNIYDFTIRLTITDPTP